MRHNKYDVCLCAICKEKFTPRTGNAKYCDKCRATGKAEREKQLRKKKKRAEKKPVKSWSEVIAICEKHNLSYGKAKAKGLL